MGSGTRRKTLLLKMMIPSILCLAVLQQVQAIERRHWRTLSMSEFFHEYAVPKRPVIITGLQMTKVPWTLEHVREVCGHYRAEMKRRAKNTTNWGGLVEAETIELADFIDTFATNATRQSYYLHDWSLPSSCPEIMGSPPYDEFIMPKYFAGDYFQRVFPNNFQHSWPSLFIGADGTQSDMHIDSGATNFWLFLLSGKRSGASLTTTKSSTYTPSGRHKSSR